MNEQSPFVKICRVYCGISTLSRLDQLDGVQKSFNHYKMSKIIESLLYMPPEYRSYNKYYFGRTEYSEMYSAFFGIDDN